MNQPNISDWLLYKNNQLVAFNKPATIAIQPDHTAQMSLLSLAQIYTKNTLHLVHRLDRPASGVVLFAKNKKALAHLNRQFQERTIQKAYLAVVKNRPDKDTGTLFHFLQKNSKTNRSYVCDASKKNAKHAELNYEYLASSDTYHLLKIGLVTGRYHQIRAQLAAIGCPIKGDVKYGFRRSNADRSIHLHAWQLEFRHPVSDEAVLLTAPLPQGDPVWVFFNAILPPIPSAPV